MRSGPSRRRDAAPELAAHPVARRLVLAGLLLASAALLVTDAVHDAVTVDEFAHLPAGLHYLETGRFDVYNLSPPLLRVLAALPVLAARPAGDVTRFTGAPHHWALGYAFMAANAARYHALFVLGRLPIALLALCLALAVYAFARRNLGPSEALAAAALAAFCPTVLAHGHLVGTDVGCALGMFVACWAAVAAIRRPTLARSVLLGLALGAALLTKFSALALYPIVGILTAVGLVRRDQLRARRLAAIAGAAVLSILVVDAGYLGEGVGRPLAAYELHSARLERLASGPLGGVPLPLPRDFVEGLDSQGVEAAGYYTVYFHGRLARGGWWYYLPAAFALKTTLPMLALLAAGLVVLVRRRLGDPLLAAFLTVPPLVFAALAIGLTDIDLGVRYLMPSYPFLFLIASLPVARTAGAALLRRAAGALVAAHVAVSAAATPHHLAYFNALAGDADGAYRWLADSNLDWGQELQDLHAYMGAHGITHVRLAYFGRVAPEVYGIDYELLRGRLEPGVYAVSATFLAGLPYFLYDHGTVYDAPANAFTVFRRYTPRAVLGHSLFVYELENPER